MPLFALAQVTLVPVMLDIIALGLIIESVSVTEHPLASVTVTV